MKSSLRSSIIKNTPANVINSEFAIHFGSRKCFFKITKNEKTFRAFRYTWDTLTIQQNIFDPKTKKKTTINPFWDCEYGNIKELMKNLDIKTEEGEKRAHTPEYRSIKGKLDYINLHGDFHYAIAQGEDRMKMVFIVDVAGDPNPKCKSSSGFIFTGVFHVIIYDAKHGLTHYYEEFYQEHEFKKNKLNMSHTANEMNRIENRGGNRKVKAVVTVDSILEESNVALIETIEVVNSHADELATQADETLEMKIRMAAITRDNERMKASMVKAGLLNPSLTDEEYEADLEALLGGL
ncbi:hypothetical protein [Aeromonas rivipollensis]|uniref:hypothetical protein n=1 Tax=Aeromonas rivipollensis TaxID=948519 RepID=UPI003D1CED37